MPLQPTDWFSVNRGGVPGTAQSGTYYVTTLQRLNEIVGIPLLTELVAAGLAAPGGQPAGPLPHAYIDDYANPDVLYIWSASTGTYEGIVSNPSVVTIGMDGSFTHDDGDGTVTTIHVVSQDAGNRLSVGSDNAAYFSSSEFCDLINNDLPVLGPLQCA